MLILFTACQVRGCRTGSSMPRHRPAVNVDGYFGCFAAVEDNRYTACTIELCTDIPVDHDPASLFNFADEYAGHAFLRLSKTCGKTTVTRSVGFYPLSGWKTFSSDAPVDGKLVNDELHEFDAACRMRVTAAEFDALVAYVRQLSRLVKYDTNDYNCTDFALGVFNRLRKSDPVKITRYSCFGSLKPVSTPQAVYRELKRRCAGVQQNLTIVVATSKKLYAGKNSGFCY